MSFEVGVGRFYGDIDGISIPVEKLCRSAEPHFIGLCFFKNEYSITVPVIPVEFFCPYTVLVILTAAVNRRGENIFIQIMLKADGDDTAALLAVMNNLPTRVGVTPSLRLATEITY